MFLIPAAHGWNFVQLRAEETTWDVRSAATLEEVAPMLNGSSDVILGLPVSAVLAQRLRLPALEAAEFGEMVRIQIEKALPYSSDEVTTDFEVIEQTAEGCIVSAVAVHNQKLSDLAAPLLERGIIPRQVTVYAAQRAATHAAVGRAFLIYPENEALVCAISEGGKIGFTRSLEGADVTQLQRDLPQLALSAALQGIDTSFPVVLLDESLYELRETVQGLFGSKAALMAVEAPPAATSLNLLPASWRQRRSALVRQADWKKRLGRAGAAYGGLLFLIVAYLLILRFEVSRLDSRIAHDEPNTEFVKKTETRWKALSPAIDPHYYPIEVLLNLFNGLPSSDVRITTYNQSSRQISVDGEAKSAALAYQFADAVKKNPELKTFQFEMAAPRILPNDHAQFRLEGKPK